MAAGIGNKRAMWLKSNDKIDFAFTCKTIGKLAKKLKINPAEAKGLKGIPLAKDPIVVIADPNNGVTDLSLAQLTELFKGNIKNWSELGDADLPVRTVTITPGMESGMLLFKEFAVAIINQEQASEKKAARSSGLPFSAPYQDQIHALVRRLIRSACCGN